MPARETCLPAGSYAPWFLNFYGDRRDDRTETNGIYLSFEALLGASSRRQYSENYFDTFEESAP